jgi:DNA-binding CsgD family transcriptional regulator
MRMTQHRTRDEPSHRSVDGCASPGDASQFVRLFMATRTGRPTAGWGSLTNTEHDVVDLLLDGRTNRMIGAQLGISRRTVETHLSHVFGKLGMRTRVELAAQAARRGAPGELEVTGRCPTCHRAA